MDEDDESPYSHTHDAASILFGHQHHPHAYHDFSSSPMLRPQAHAAIANAASKKQQIAVSNMVADSNFAWSDLKSPEHMGLAELDDLLGGY